MVHLLDGIGLTSGESFAGLGADAAPAAGRLVCINTFAFDRTVSPSAGTPFVLVGDQRYDRDAPGKIQVVVLNRGNLALVAHRFYDDNSSGRSSLSSYLSTLTGSHLAIVAGGRTGTVTQDVPGLSTILAKIGASSLQVPNASGGFQPIHSWSVIGVPGLKYGEAWQKAFWSDFAVPPSWTVTNCPQQVDVDGLGNLTGYLTPDTAGTHYTYAHSGWEAYVTFDTRASSSASSNGISWTQVGGPSNTDTRFLPGTSVGGFHYMVLQARMGYPTTQGRVFSTNKMVSGQLQLDIDGLNQFLEALRAGYPVADPVGAAGSYIGIFTSIGNVSAVDATGPGRDIWGTVAQELQQKFGATAHFFNTLKSGDSYSMIGIGNADSKLPPAFALEAVSSAGSGEPPARLFGYLERSPKGYFAPVAADPSGQMPPDLLAIAYQDASNWPHNSSSQYKAANTDIASKLALGVSDVRQAYTNIAVDWGGRLAALNSLTWQEMPGATNGAYTQSQFEDLRSDFRQEFLWVPDVDGLIAALQRPYDTTSSQSLNVLQVAQDVYNQIKPPSGALTDAQVFEGASMALGFAGKLAGPEFSLPMGVLSTSFTLASKLAKSNTGAPLDQIVAPVEQLAVQVQNNTQATILGFELLRDIRVSDYGKLSAAARKAENQWQYSGWDIASQVNILNIGYNQSFYGDLMPPAFAAYRLLPGSRNKTVTTADKYTCSFCVIPCLGCIDPCGFTGQPFSKAAATGQYTFVTGFDSSGAQQTELWVWGKHGFDAGDDDTVTVPSASFTDNLSRSVDDGGIGLSPPIFWRQKFGPPTDVKC